MTSNYQIRDTRSSLDRQLTILKRNINVVNNISPKKKYRSHHGSDKHNFDNILSQNNLLDKIKLQTRGTAHQLAHKRSQSFVKLFISQLKKNAANIQSQRLVEPSKMTRQIDSLYNASYNQDSTGHKGIKSNEKIQLIISILTVFAIIVLHFLSTFQYLFYDYRNQYSPLFSIRLLKYACLFFTAIKIFSSLTLTTIVLGKRLQYIEQIAMSYIYTSDFYLDILVLISAIQLIVMPSNEYAGIFGFFVTIMNVVYLQRMQQSIDVLFLTNSVKKQVFALIKLLLANIIVVHFMATILVGIVLIQYSSNWMEKYGISQQVWWVKYLYSLYWSASIMATVGFGDITINSYIQAIVLTIIILFGCLILSYNIAQVSNIIDNLKRMPDEVKDQLAILRRLAKMTKIDQNLHRSIGEYIVHSAEIKKSFQIKERFGLIQSLPSQMRQEFMQQTSRNFFINIPFFFMLENQTKKLIFQKMQNQVLSPNQYITHKRYGLTKMYILRMGTIGLAYKKKGSKLNGTVLDKIQIKQQRDAPQLLNTYLLIRGKKLVYDIICQEYCVVAYLQFQNFLQSLKESDRDFQLYHQSRDQTQFRVNQWDKKVCHYCYVKHSLFVCPKTHYIPIRSQTYLKSQTHINQVQKRPNFKYQREKPLLAIYSARKLWKRLFIHVQKAFEIKVRKSQLLRMKKTNSNEQDSPKEERQNRITKTMFQQYFLKYSIQKVDQFSWDALKDYKYYFNKSNPDKLAQTKLKKDFLPITIQRLRSL